MLDVFFTIDVEIWCDGWKDIDRKFPEYYKKYIFGKTRFGDYGLPFQLRMFSDHGLKCVCFVEPLFSTRFGVDPLAEVVEVVQSSGHEVQLHMHTEWVDESIEPLIDNVSKKRQHLFHYSLEEQVQLIGAGVRLLKSAGAENLTAFRAGSFGFNANTLKALSVNNIQYDSSYNATMFGPASGVGSGRLLTCPIKIDSVFEYPMTVFHDGFGKLRHAQLTSCSFSEIESLLWKALDDERKSFVILSHNFELLSPSKNSPDAVVINRLRKLCRFLDHNRDCFQVRGFHGLMPQDIDMQHGPLKTGILDTSVRVLEQVYRRKYL